MQKKDNLITKFREFFFNLPKNEQKNLWNIMTALRAKDGGDDFLKAFTTCRIRGELLGRAGDEGHEYGSFVALNLQGAKELPFTGLDSYSAKKITDIWKGDYCYGHWGGHFENAIRALNECRPEKSMRDLQKFLEY